MVHPGRGIFGSDFGTVTFTLLNMNVPEYSGRYFRLFDDQGEVKSPDDRKKTFLRKTGEFYSKQNNYKRIPGSPVAYWISEEMIKGFDKGIPFKKLGQTTKGIITGNNDRYLRFWWEVSYERINFHAKDADDAHLSKYKWFPCTKGGSFRKWYGNKEYIIDWENNGDRVINDAKKEKRHSQDYNDSLKFKPGITWSGITSSVTSFRFEVHHLVEHIGMCIFPFNEDNLKGYLGFTNSNVAEKYLSFLSPTIAINAGEIDKLPIIAPSKDALANINAVVEQNIEMEKDDWDSFETSWDFHKHPLIQRTTRISNAFNVWLSESSKRFSIIKENEEKLNSFFIHLYKLEKELTPEEDESKVTVYRPDIKQDIRSFVSYAVGCMMGRYSLDVDGLAYAGGDWDNSKYKTFIPDKDAIIPITDDEFFKDDIVGRFVDIVRIVYGTDTLEENLKFIADALDEKGAAPREVIRNYFLNDCYKDHCKIYQKRPIYWLFDSGKKNGFKCLVYMHRYQPDTIARIRTDYVHEQQARYRTAISGLERQINGASTSDRVRLNKQLEKLKDQAEETRLYEEKIHHLADQMISIDLDDGVKHNYAIFQDVLAKIK